MTTPRSRHGAPPPPGADVPVVPGAVHRVRIEGRDARGRGLASVGRRPLRVPNALPGETLDVRLVHVGRHVATGQVAHVVEGSPERVRDACRHGDVCPGCGLRTTAAPSRLAWKRDRVVEALAAGGLTGVEVDDTEPSPVEDGWRHKAYLVARRTSRGIHLGLFGEGTHRLVDVEGCLAHAPLVEAVIDRCRRALARVDPPIYDERSRVGWLRAVAVRASSAGEALVTLVTTDQAFSGAHALATLVRQGAPAIAGVVQNEQAAAENAPFGPRFRPLDGVASLVEASSEFGLRVSAGSFFQVNPAVGAAIHDRIRREAAHAPSGPALDLYGGVGATALRLAADGRPVTLVEAPGSALADARWNLREHPAAQVVEGRVEDVVAGLLEARPPVVVVNPPRSGLLRPVADALAAARPALLLYASCDPGTLARDLA